MPTNPSAPDGASASYLEALDALHERIAPGRLVSSPTGHVVASAARLPGSLSILGLAAVAAKPESGPVADLFAVELLDLHRDLLRRTLREVMSHLAARTSDGSALLAKQLIQGELADIAMRLGEAEAMPADDRWTRWQTHRQLVIQGRRLLRLLGARGFLADGPAAALHLAEVTGGAYLHPMDADD
jgi:hypothetical protein